jgi:hypothetical protein
MPFCSKFPKADLLGTPVVFVGDPGSACWGPRYVLGTVPKGQARVNLGLFVRIAVTGIWQSREEACWGPR